MKKVELHPKVTPLTKMPLEKLAPNLALQIIIEKRDNQ